MEQRLTGFRVGQGKQPVSDVTYPDDVTIFIMSVTEFQLIEDAIRLFEKTSGARLKSKSHRPSLLVVGRFSTSFLEFHTTPDEDIWYTLPECHTTVHHRHVDKPHWTSTFTCTGILTP
jgi:hypothetical protein